MYEKIKTQKSYKKINKTYKTQKNEKTQNSKKNNKTYKTQKKDQNNKPQIKTHMSTELVMFSANADGLRGKTHSLKNEINEVNAHIFAIQQTKYSKKGKLKMDDFHIFEAIRKNKEQGGTMLGIHKSLEPVLIEEYSDTFEMIVADIKVANKDIRIITGYGPQETWTENERMPFFTAFEEEVSKANMKEKSLIIEMDFNSKLGKKYVKEDPHEISPKNGKVLSGIIERHALVVANGLNEKASGVITRKRITKTSIEESVIDYVLLSNDMQPLLVSCNVDSERKRVLTKTTRRKRIESDHNSIICKFKLEWNAKIEKERIEIFNFKDDIAMKKFKDMTNNNTFLSSVFDDDKNVDVQGKRFLKRLNGILHKCFKKIRIKNSSKSKKQIEISNLIEQQKILKFKTDQTSKTKLKNVEEELIEKMSDDLYKIVKEEVKKINTENGGFNSGHLWQLKKKLSGKQSNPPSAVLDQQGNLSTTNDQIKEATLNHFKKVLENRPIKEGLEKHKEEREKLCEQRIEKAKKNVTPNWKKEDVVLVVKQLKKKKSRDPDGYSNELIQNGGEDLTLAILKMMNNIKKQQKFPECLQPCNITSLFKNKGKKQDLNNHRGVFRVSVFRNIMDKLIFNDEYESLDKHLTDSNVGGRKRRNIRDNIFVINAILNSLRKGNEESCDLTVYDIEKCFDSLWVQECINTFFENGLQNDKLVLLYEETKSAKIAIKTSAGITERISIQNTIMQGIVFGSLICTSVVDKLAKMFYAKPDLLYKYKDTVDIPPLGMVDDVFCVNKCSNITVASNATVNAFMENNKLKLSATKCARIHIGKKCTNCPELKIHENVMKTTYKEKYLGDIITNEGKLDQTIEQRVTKAWSYFAEIRALLKEFPFGKRKTEVGIILREAMFVNGILYNSEAWHGLTESHVEKLSNVDRKLMRFLLSSHAKTPSEFLYLETGVKPVSFVISSRRLSYLKEIHSREDHELIKRVYEAQKQNPSQGDWIELVQKDMNTMGVEENMFEKLDKLSARTEIKTKISEAAFKSLKDIQKTHIKVKHIIYEKFEMQQYLMSPLISNKEAEVLTALRSHTVRGIKDNFHSHNKNNIQCELCTTGIDNQEHCMKCPKLAASMDPTMSHIQYNHIYGSISEQKEIANMYLKLLQVREELLTDQDDQDQEDLDDDEDDIICPPGAFNTGPST